MQNNKINFVVDLQMGSTSKGLVASYLSKQYKIDAASTNNLANAGHTLVYKDKKFISKILPVSAFWNSFGHQIRSYIGPGAGFYLKQLFKEMDECQVTPDLVKIHPRAMVIESRHAEMESGKVGDMLSTKHLASTMQGAGAVQAERMMRGHQVKLAADYPELKDMICKDWLDEVVRLDDKIYWLHEGSQGFSLGILHGLEFPKCTSRECTVTRELTDLGAPPSMVGDVYGVMRPWPIRVGNVVEDGETVGYSGGWYPDQKEVTWADVAAWSGAPDDLAKGELTTVTKRVRRVATLSLIELERAVKINDVTHIALNFANYLDWSCYGIGGGNEIFKKLPDKVRGFVYGLECDINKPVTLIGTGPDADHVIDRRL